MKIVATSDLHGHLPPIEPCDLLLIAGDICPDYRDYHDQAVWLNTTFRWWLDCIPARRVVACWGNHDIIGQRAPLEVPDDLRWRVVTDQLCTAHGLKIYGTPWQRTFGKDWAFNLDDPELGEKFDRIPKCDILLSHGPPLHYGDQVLRNGIALNVGSYALTKRIDQIKPVLTVFGHIHPGFGQYRIGDALAVNASYMGDRFDNRSQRWRYHPTNPPVSFEL